MFSEVSILKEKTQGNNLFLRIKLQESPRMSRYKFSGVSKSEADQIRDDLDLFSGKIITEALKMNVKNISRTTFIEKGFLKAKSTITTESDTLVNNSKILKIEVDKGSRVKINEIIIDGNYFYLMRRLKVNERNQRKKMVQIL